MATVTPLRIGLADHGRRMLLQDFLDAEEEQDYRYELAREVLEVTEVPDDPHGYVVCNLNRAISDFDRRHPGVILRFGEASGFRLWLPGMISGRTPDFAIVPRGASKDRRGRRRPAIAFEVVSEGSEARTRDYVTNREEYLAYGLLEYWILDPESRRVTVLMRDGDTWAESVFIDGQTAEGLILPGFAVAVETHCVLPDDDD